MSDPVASVQLVQHPICVVLLTSCENDNFVFFTHLSKELTDSWPDQKIAMIVRHLYVVYKCLIKIKNQAEFLTVMGRQVWLRLFHKHFRIATYDIRSLNQYLLGFLFAKG